MSTGGDAARMARIIAYVDEFNLYYGLRSKGSRGLYWLDVYRLAENLLKPGQRLLEVHYFTYRIMSRPGDEDTRARLGRYLEALETLRAVRLHYATTSRRRGDARDARPPGRRSRRR